MEELKIDPRVAYDVVELPSRGIHYPNKKKSVRVAYLTASDENILSAPSLMNSNLMISELLKRKVLDKDIDTEDLVEEDIRTILIFLRNTAFGTEYKVTTTDPKTKKDFEVTIDLSSLKVKDFTLVENSEGEFQYYFKKSKIDITFKFLNKKQEREIEKLKSSWNGLGVAPIITKQLEFMIKSAQGNKDQLNIKNLVENLPITDSQEFRKFVEENKPGLDLTQTITTPSGENIQLNIGFGVEFFLPFFGL